MKSRGVYETPGGTILLAAHRAIESITLDRGAAHLKDELMPRYAELIYNGFWFAPEREMLQALIDQSQANVTGTVRLKLYKGSVQVVGRKSPTASTTRRSPPSRPTRSTTSATPRASSSSTRCACACSAAPAADDARLWWTSPAAARMSRVRVRPAGPRSWGVPPAPDSGPPTLGIKSMAIARVERRLAAIMVADIVGYSRLIEADEAGTLEAIRDLRRAVIDPLLARSHGRIVKLMGDGLIGEFGSVVDAVACAAALQRGVAARQAEVPPGRRIVFRIGVNLGDVVVEGEDLLGDGVNVAARLEQLCEPGGVLVSGTAYDHLQGKLDLPFDDAGEQRLKNIARPVRTWRIRLDGAKPARRRSNAWWPRRWALPAAAAALIALLVAGAWWWFRPDAPASGPPAIAVLPFVNMSGDPAQDYLGAGVAEDIITVLATFPALRVVSRLSSFTYDKPVRVQEVGQALGVRYVLEGSVRRTADKVRVTAQLIDAETGDHVWANRFDAEAADVVAIQEDVANKIYGSLAGLTGEIRKEEEQGAWRKSAPSLAEYDYYLRGHELFFHFTAEDNLRARQIWQEGLSKFPDPALLRIKLAFAYLEPVVELWTQTLGFRHRNGVAAGQGSRGR